MLLIGNNYSIEKLFNYCEEKKFSFSWTGEKISQSYSSNFVITTSTFTKLIFRFIVKKQNEYYYFFDSVDTSQVK